MGQKPRRGDEESTTRKVLIEREKYKERRKKIPFQGKPATTVTKDLMKRNVRANLFCNQRQSIPEKLKME